jgi:hypothetical protein
LHTFEEVSQLLAGIVIRVGDVSKPMFVVVEKVAEFYIHLMSFRETDYDTIDEL